MRGLGTRPLRYVRLFCGFRCLRDRGRPALDEGKMPSILGRRAVLSCTYGRGLTTTRKEAT